MKYEWFNTLEEFVEWELRANKGTHTIFTKDKIEVMYKELYGEDSVNNSINTNGLTKEYMIDEILKKKSLIEIYNEHENMFGIKPSKWVDKFGLTKSQREKMEKEEYLFHVVYYKYEKVFTGTYTNVKYYRARDYFEHSVEEVEKWKEDNIRGYKKRKEREKRENSMG